MEQKLYYIIIFILIFNIINNFIFNINKLFNNNLYFIFIHKIKKICKISIYG